jgi:flavin-dependent dehydrogenase
VAVFGGGPAGTATALALARLGCSAIVIERTYHNAFRIGETLPPSIRPLLGGLGVWEAFLAQNHCRSFGIHSAWGQVELYANDFIFNPYGSGWHLDRARFDLMLAQAAENTSVHVFRGVQLVSIQERRGGGWYIEIGAEGKQLGWDARFLVDATGRASTIARKRGASRVSYDHLIGAVAFFRPDSRAPAANHALLVEAVEDGWWYSAPLPNGQVVAAFMTDADIYARTSKNARYCLNEQLQKTKHTKVRLCAWTPTSVPQVVSANSSQLDRVTCKNWLAAGDAAMAFDPLSSQGIYKALETGLLAAKAIRDGLSGDAEPLRGYGIKLQKDFDRYLAVRGYYYTQERRWPDSLFWKRRHEFNRRLASDEFAGSVPFRSHARRIKNEIKSRSTAVAACVRMAAP